MTRVQVSVTDPTALASPALTRGARLSERGKKSRFEEEDDEGGDKNGIKW